MFALQVVLVPNTLRWPAMHWHIYLPVPPDYVPPWINRYIDQVPPWTNRYLDEVPPWINRCTDQVPPWTNRYTDKFHHELVGTLTKCQRELTGTLSVKYKKCKLSIGIQRIFTYVYMYVSTISIIRVLRGTQCSTWGRVLKISRWLLSNHPIVQMKKESFR